MGGERLEKAPTVKRGASDPDGLVDNLFTRRWRSEDEGWVGNTATIKPAREQGWFLLSSGKATEDGSQRPSFVCMQPGEVLIWVASSCCACFLNSRSHFPGAPLSFQASFVGAAAGRGNDTSRAPPN